jgi:hypothetical protein
MEDVGLNYQSNFPIVIGKGLGSTWFAYVPVPISDVYSVGTSVADTPAGSVTSPVQFIFNFVPASFLYKWGIAGGIILAYLFARFYGGGRNQLAMFPTQAGSSAKWQRLWLLVAFLYVVHNFTYIGAMRDSVITSLLAFYIESKALADVASVEAVSVPEEAKAVFLGARGRPIG